MARLCLAARAQPTAVPFASVTENQKCPILGSVIGRKFFAGTKNQTTEPKYRAHICKEFSNFNYSINIKSYFYKINNNFQCLHLFKAFCFTRSQVGSISFSSTGTRSSTCNLDSSIPARQESQNVNPCSISGLLVQFMLMHSKVIIF